MTASQEKAFLRHCEALGPGVKGSPRWKEIAERMSQKGKKVACKKLEKTYHKDRPLGKDLRRLITKWKWSDPREKVSEFAGVSWDRLSDNRHRHAIVNELLEHVLVRHVLPLEHVLLLERLLLLGNVLLLRHVHDGTGALRACCAGVMILRGVLECTAMCHGALCTRG